MQTKYLCVLIHIWIKGEVGASLNRFQPSSKIFYWPFHGGTSFVDLLCFCSVLCLLWFFVRVCLIVLCGHLLGKGWPLVSRLWCLTVSLSLSHWYSGSDVVLDCIDSWSLHPYLLWIFPGINGCHSNTIWSFSSNWNFHQVWLLGNEHCMYCINYLLHFFKTLLTHCLIQLER